MPADRVRESVESEFRPRLESVATRLSELYPALRFGVASIRSGDATPTPGHNLYLYCSFPERIDRDDDHLVLEIELWNLTGDPRIYADVCWGGTGHQEASIGVRWKSSEDWPLVSADGLDFVRDAFAGLVVAFERAVGRGHPSYEQETA